MLLIKEIILKDEDADIEDEDYLNAKIILKLWVLETKERTNLYLLAGDYKETNVEKEWGLDEKVDDHIKDHLKKHSFVELKDDITISGDLFVAGKILNECN